MENSLHIPKFLNTNARMAFAKRLNLPYHDNMQDWEYEVADVVHIDDFLNAYDLNDITDDERFLLIEMFFSLLKK